MRRGLVDALPQPVLEARHLAIVVLCDLVFNFVELESPPVVLVYFPMS